MSTVDATRSTSVTTIANYTTGLAAGLGAWIFWSPILTTETIWILLLNNLVIGVAIAAVASVNALLASEGRGRNLVLSVVLVVLGLWTVAAPFVLGVSTLVLFWSNLIAGGLVAVFAVVGLVATVRTEDAATARSTSA